SRDVFDRIASDPSLVGIARNSISNLQGSVSGCRGDTDSRKSPRLDPGASCDQTGLNLDCWSLWNVGRHECTGQLPHSWRSASDSKSTVIFRPSSDELPVGHSPSAPSRRAIALPALPRD